ncbi:alpha-glucan family phosphorylase [Limnochorda pilosa]|uniref:glycogen phosphorylase n=1 Tax=Limnochorda pilosa TaxID=1555112 RepID=A0A0K2SL19_LIMPI|nr:alpha-glucan family phosphorylase [Limnochorda pilosa]BAS27795.1 alpha-glucan phosphorylase [Limnochorda pilosa]
MDARPKVAYFCMEYGLHEDFPLYAGGLGILAGDHLKAAGDAGLPLVGLGLLWRQGYTRQIIEGGRPVDAYPLNDHMYRRLQDTGLTVTVPIRRREVKARAWLLDAFGNAPLYLLDTNLPENEDRWITGQLYGWFGEERVAQEMILGIGGVRLLRAMGFEPDVYHFNEGHAVLAGIELIREKMEAGSTFDEAWQATRGQIVFTTHTPVEAGNESHRLELLEYLGAFNGLSREQMEQIGGNPFNMTVAGLRLARAANGVSQLHARTARRMWAQVTDAPEITGITNGVHVPTWQDRRMVSAASGSDEALWQAHQSLKAETLAFIHERTGIRLAADKLLIGFARRAAPYKRSDLIFRRPQVIEPYLRDGRIQIVFAGKGHPLDDTGKEIVARLVDASRRFPESVVFVPDYDMAVGRALTRGTDLWLNNPIRPLEACGTSGMKAAMNGVLNLSVLDGWWPEACRHGENGWQLGDGYEGPDPDAHDLEALYRVLLREVVPTYYQDRPRWIRMMRESIRSTVDAFSAATMMRAYVDRLYAPEAGSV